MDQRQYCLFDETFSLSLLMDSSVWFKTIYFGLFFVIIKGSQTRRKLGSAVVECLTPDRWVVGSCLTGGTAVCP